MTCDGHRPHTYEPGDCSECGHPKSDHPGGQWEDPEAEPLWGEDGPAVGQVITIPGTTMTRRTGTHWEST